jgi:hypothetical protein
MLAPSSGKTVVHTRDEKEFIAVCEPDFDLICCTDYWRRGLIADLRRVAANGAWVVLNTPAARGGNWSALPESIDFLHELLAAEFEVIELRITDAGRRSTPRAAASLIARVARKWPPP